MDHNLHNLCPYCGQPMKLILWNNLWYWECTECNCLEEYE